ncbi:MAG: hypothetical protein EOP56_17025 [Sphingobacteriales bacterium]|nr:MAG: hypothetical protein EOP56_17025 [Sphingobacteriales bacterium]
MSKTIYKLGFLVYLLLLVMAVLFYKERIVLLDDSLYTFNILLKGNFSIEHYRFIAVFTEVFPLLASKLSLSLKSVAVAYSAGFVIYYALCYFVTGTVFRNPRMALVLLLFNILFVSHAFYWMLSELTQGVAMLIPLLAYLEGKEVKQVGVGRWLIIIAVLITLVFAHPLMLFPVSFGLLFLLLRASTKAERQLYITVGVSFVVLTAAKMLFVKEAYDSQSMQSINNVKNLFPDYIRLHSNKVFLRNCLTKYYWIPICFLLTVFVYVKQAKWKQLGLYLLYIPGFLMLINISYFSSDVYEFYIENLYLPLGFLISLPLVYDVLSYFDKPAVSWVLLSTVVLTGMVRIYSMRKPYKDRIDWLRHTYVTYTGKKVMIDEKTTPKGTLLMSWGSPYEFWLLSTIETGNSASIIIHPDLEHINWMREPRDAFATTWGLFSYHDLDKRYFKFTDTIQSYELVK